MNESRYVIYNYHERVALRGRIQGDEVCIVWKDTGFDILYFDSAWEAQEFINKHMQHMPPETIGIIQSAIEVD